ncbi:cache domain-containing protein [Paracoccus jeotgali]|uniref:cache domain-containing protein n=1 Tax=Paracoccus jeotgali TaxID=2065379 RepID=UPI0028B072EB|nr:cache domain-containing protein [Paracoccus jeotgali]
MSQLPTLTVRKALFAFALSCILVMCLVALAFAHLRGDRFTDSAFDHAARFRTTAAAEDLARTLERDWQDLAFLTGRVAGLDPEQLTYLMTGASGDGRRISWVGYADLDGQVIAATNGLLVGQNVAERPWFRNGLSGGFAGDVHDAVLLAQLLEGEGAEPLRFLDLSKPVTDASGQPSGVIGMHINASWLAEHLRETSETFGIDLYLINPNGDISASSADEAPDTAELQVLRAAQIGAQSGGRETWPDGREYFSALVPQVTYGDLPDFGWRMVGRLDADYLDVGLDLIRSEALYALLIAVFLIGLLTVLVARAVRTPFAELAASAQRIADGSQEYPPSFRTTREAALLSAALARLQQDRITDER